MTDTRTSDWDPRDPSVLKDQRGTYDDMRERCPVAYSDFMSWSVFRHGDVKAILDDPETYSNATKRRAIPNGMDAPEHTVYRRALEPFFEPEEMAAFEPVCRGIATDTLNALQAAGDTEVEIISGFAEPFTAKSLGAFLGWPADTAERLGVWIRDNQHVAFSLDREMGKSLALELIGHVADAVKVRRDAGLDTVDDVTARLMKIEVNGASLSDEEIASALRNWVAGHGTVAAALGNVVLYLAEHPDTQQQLRDEPTLLPAAIEEILRVEGPLVANQRTTTRDVELGGRSIGAGERLTLVWVAANRDGRVFDDPGVVRMDRDQTDNLLYGAGIHDCMGAPLARLELQIAVEELLRGTSSIELTGTPPVPGIYPENGLRSLNVRLIRS